MTRSAKVVRAVFVVSILALASTAAAANNSEQVVFSGTGFGTFALNGGDPTVTPLGFWIWCESDSGNKYLGECHGAMYFYALGVTRSVEDAGEGAIVENGEGLYSISVVDKKGQGLIACTLTNLSDDPGPSNMITVECTAPGAVIGSGTAPKSVVNVTGPPGS
jgi:hypothetical protein